MLLTKEVEVQINGRNVKHYEELGYKVPKHKDKSRRIVVPLNTFIKVKVKDLPIGSHAKIKVKCDYCERNGNENIFEREYREYLKTHEKFAVKLDCCAKCQPIKSKECNLINYGVESKFQLEEVKEKQKQTMIKKYGVDHVMKIKGMHEKATQTWLNRPLEERQEILNKRNDTFKDRFGGHPLKVKEILNKAKETNMKNLGVPWVMQNSEKLAKSRDTMFKNNSVACSRQQRYLANLFGGILNYPQGNCNIDIAFPEQKVTIEYLGNGHNLSVKLGDITEDEFKKKEIRRYQYLKSKGWKQIEITSPYDYLPSDKVLIKEFNKALEWFKSDKKGRWHYNINIGTKINDATYGKLRRIKEEDLKREIS